MAKSYKVRFYSGSALGEGQRSVSEILAALGALTAAGTALPQHASGGLSYEMRDFASFNDGAAFRGVFAVLRDDAPHIRDAIGDERPIQLAVNEHVIEKNHFLYFRERQLLVWQVNMSGSHLFRFEQYLGHCAGHAVALADIVDRTALQRLNDGVLTRLELRIARPTNAALVDPNDWENPVMQLLNSAGAGTIEVQVSTRSDAGLSAALKSVVERFLPRDETRALRVKLQGDEELIDLLADRISDSITVEMHGLYPDTDTLFEELAAARDRRAAQLDEIFGVGDAVLG